MAADELTDTGFEICYTFLTASNARVLSSGQQLLLKLVDTGTEPHHITVWKKLIVLRFPIKYHVAMLWFGAMCAE